MTYLLNFPFLADHASTDTWPHHGSLGAASTSYNPTGVLAPPYGLYSHHGPHHEPIVCTTEASVLFNWYVLENGNAFQASGMPFLFNILNPCSIKEWLSFECLMTRETTDCFFCVDIHESGSIRKNDSVATYVIFSSRRSSEPAVSSHVTSLLGHNK